MLGRPTPLVPPELMAEAEAHRVRIFNGETFANVETVRRHKDGTVVNVSVSAAAIYNSEGEAAGMVAMFADISGRKRDREALQRSSARLEALVAASPLAIIVQEFAHRRDQALERGGPPDFRLDRQEAIGQKLLAVPAEKMAEGIDFRERIMRGEHFADVEAVRRRKDGSDVPVSLVRGAAARCHGDGKRHGAARGRYQRAQTLGVVARTFKNPSRCCSPKRTASKKSIPRVIQTLCEGLGWVAGARRIVAKDDGLMRHTEDWGLAEPGIQLFLRQSAGRVDTTGENAGLLRRVWAGGKPVWLADIGQEPTFVRGAAAVAAGLHCAFAFPILVSGEFYGVIELLAPKYASATTKWSRSRRISAARSASSSRARRPNPISRSLRITTR